MAVTRVIYTQGSVGLSGLNAGCTWFAGSAITGAGVVLSGVQSANFTSNSPKQDVNSFGVLGAINKVQVEPSTATMELALVVNSGNGADTWLSGLVADAIRATPSGITVTSAGIGQLTQAILTSFQLEASVGAIPTLNLSFEGISGAYIAAGTAPTSATSAVVPVSTPDSFGTIYWNGTASGCPQTVRASWEMPIERINCLGSPINSPTIFSRPPGTVSFSAEGCDPGMFSSTSFVTGIKIGPFRFVASNVQETTRTSNMAVGEAMSTFNITSESTALNSTVTSNNT
jgi:hypothetical protein